MKVPADARHLKTASVVLTNIESEDLPEGITCHMPQLTKTAHASGTTRADANSSDQVKSTLVAEPSDQVRSSADAKSSDQVKSTPDAKHNDTSSLLSRFTGSSDAKHSHQFTSGTDAKSINLVKSAPDAKPCDQVRLPTPESKPRDTTASTSGAKANYSLDPIPNYHSSHGVWSILNFKYSDRPSPRTRGSPKVEQRHVTLKRECKTPNKIPPSQGDPKSRLSRSDYNGSPRKRRKLDLHPAQKNQMPELATSTRVTDKVDKIDEPENTALQSKLNIEEITDKLLKKKQETNTPSRRDNNTSQTSTIDMTAALKSANMTEKSENTTCNANEQLFKANDASVIYKRDSTEKIMNEYSADGSKYTRMPKVVLKPKVKLEKITEKLMKEQQDRLVISPSTLPYNWSPHRSIVNPKGSTEYTSILPLINKEAGSKSLGQRDRKRSTHRYVRSGSAHSTSTSEEIIPQERCSSVPGVNKLKETRKRLKSAISASTVSSSKDLINFEYWYEGGQKNVPNILVKSKYVPKGLSNVTSPTCPRPAVSDSTTKDSSVVISNEIHRLKIIDELGNHGSMTKIKPRKTKQKISDVTELPGPSGLQATHTSDIHTSAANMEKISPKNAWLKNAVHIKNPNTFPYMQEFELPVEGSQMMINLGSPKKGRKTKFTYKNEIGSGSPISFQFSSNSATVNTDTSTSTKADNVKVIKLSSKAEVMKMGNFAISKSQEIFPINHNDPFPKTVKKVHVSTIKRPYHAITYADYCTQMDNAESNKTSTVGISPDGERAMETEFGNCDDKLDKKHDDNSIRQDASALLQKLTDLYVNKTKSKENAGKSTTTIAQGSSNATSLEATNNMTTDCLKMVVGVKIKQEKVDVVDEDDTDGVHLSDHRYTKTPDASPAKTKTQGILHKTSTMAGTVTMDKKKQPVYAVKYGNKLFLIPRNGDKNKANSTSLQNLKKTSTSLKAISPKVKTEKNNDDDTIQTMRKNSPCASRSKVLHKVTTGKVVTKRKIDFTRQLELNQESAKRKQQSMRPLIRTCRSDRVNRNAKLVHITPTNGSLQVTSSRVSITLTKGSDSELKRWSRFGDFKARLTYDDSTLEHIEADELKSGFYKLTPVGEMSQNKTVLTIMTCVPPHDDALAEGSSFVAIGPMLKVVDTGLGKTQKEVWPPCQIGARLASILPSTALCHNNLHVSDHSFLPKIDSREWYGAQAFEIFTRKYCRQKRVVQRRKWDRNPYVKTFNYK